MPGPTRQQAMGWLGDGALPLSESERQRVAADPEFTRRATEMRDVFSGGQGDGALQTILEASLFRPPVDYRLPKEEREAYALIREGQNQIAALILFYIDQGDQLTKDPRHDHPGPSRGIHPSAWGGDGHDDLLSSGPGRGDGDDDINFTG